MFFLELGTSTDKCQKVFSDFVSYEIKHVSLLHLLVFNFNVLVKGLRFCSEVAL